MIKHATILLVIPEMSKENQQPIYARVEGVCKEKRLDFFKLLEDVSPLIREASSVLRSNGRESQI